MRPQQKKQDVSDLVATFAVNEISEISQAISLTTDQRKAANIILSSDDAENTLASLQQLHGVADNEIIQIVAKKYNPNRPVDVRKAVAACLGLSGSSSAVAALKTISHDDPSSDVRLEAYLALESMGIESASQVLGSAQNRWPNDSYFSSS